MCKKKKVDKHYKRKSLVPFSQKLASNSVICIENCTK